MHADLGDVEWDGVPELADRHARVEAAIGHRFRADLSMADIIAEARGETAQLALPLADIV